MHVLTRCLLRTLGYCMARGGMHNLLFVLVKHGALLLKKLCYRVE